MKTKTLFVLGAVLLVAGWVVDTGRAGERVFGDGTLPAYLAVYDVDGDGVLSEEERQAMREQRYERHRERILQWDTDGDGVISEQERVAAQEQLRLRIEECRVARFEEADTDDDGYLSLEEFLAIPAVVRLAEAYPEKPAVIFDHLDADDDGLISLEEFLATLRTRVRPTQPPV